MSDVTKNTVGGDGALSSSTAKRNVDAIIGGGNIASSLKIGGNLGSVATIDGGVNKSLETVGDGIGTQFIAAHDKKATGLGPTMALTVTKESNPEMFTLIQKAGIAALAQYNVTRNQQMGGL